MRHMTIAAVVLGALTSSAFGQQTFTVAELRQMFIGKKVEWVNLGITDYKADDTFEFWNMQRKQAYTGKLTFGPGTICYVVPEKNFSNCDKIFQDAKGIHLKSPNGNIVYARFQ